MEMSQKSYFGILYQFADSADIIVVDMLFESGKIRTSNDLERLLDEAEIDWTYGVKA